MNRDGFGMAFLFTQTEFFDQSAIFVNVFFGVIGQEAFPLAYHGKEGATCSVVFLEFTKVVRKTFDAVSQKCYLYFGVTSVCWRFAILRRDFRDFLFAVINCHFLKNKRMNVK
jgi:hypothetical protein